MESRSTIAVNSELVTRLSILAKKKKVARYFLANECIRTILRLYEEGGEIGDVYVSWKIIQLSREVGGFPLTPSSLISDMVSKLFVSHKDWLLKDWYDEGVVLGTILKFHFDNPSVLGSEFKRAFVSSSRRLEVLEMESEKGKGYSVRIVGEFSEELGLCLEQLIRGALSVYGIVTKEGRVSRNVVQVYCQIQREPRSASARS